MHQLQQSLRYPTNILILNTNHSDFPVQSSLKLNTLESFLVPHHPIWHTKLSLAQDNLPVLEAGHSTLLHLFHKSIA